VARTPLDILLGDYLHEVNPDFVKSVDDTPAIPPVRRLADLKAPVEDGPNEILRKRFLCRGHSMLLLGPTGIGKSTFSLQFAMHLALGKSLFGLDPVRPCRVLYVQAENDEGDMAEMRDGVLAGAHMTDSERHDAVNRVEICTVTDAAGDKFGTYLNELCALSRPDVVMVDPAFSYLGGATNDQEVVSHFTRHVLNPIIYKHNIALILAHHTNKPVKGVEKDSWTAGDFAYLGAGSAEWSNWARAVLAIRSIGSEDIFELRAAKRGKRLESWSDSFKHIAHSDTGICWREAEEHEVSDAVMSSTPMTTKERKAMEEAIAEGVSGAELSLRLGQAFGKARGRAMVEQALRSGVIAEENGTVVTSPE
jgi:hypothetical protein